MVVVAGCRVITHTLLPPTTKLLLLLWMLLLQLMLVTPISGSACECQVPLQGTCVCVPWDQQLI